MYSSTMGWLCCATWLQHCPIKPPPVGCHPRLLTSPARSSEEAHAHCCAALLLPQPAAHLVCRLCAWCVVRPRPADSSPCAFQGMTTAVQTRCPPSDGLCRVAVLGPTCVVLLSCDVLCCVVLGPTCVVYDGQGIIDAFSNATSQTRAPHVHRLSLCSDCGCELQQWPQIATSGVVEDGGPTK